MEEYLEIYGLNNNSFKPTDLRVLVAGSLKVPRTFCQPVTTYPGLLHTWEKAHL